MAVGYFCITFSVLCLKIPVRQKRVFNSQDYVHPVLLFNPELCTVPDGSPIEASVLNAIAIMCATRAKMMKATRVGFRSAIL